MLAEGSLDSIHFIKTPGRSVAFAKHGWDWMIFKIQGT